MAERPLTPRVKLAARLYVTGAAPTKGAAAEAAGLSPSYFYVQSAPGAATRNPAVQEHMDEVDQMMLDGAVQTSVLLERMGREALQKMRELMKEQPNIAIQFKAAQDLLDRSPETSKIQKHAVASFSLDGADAKELSAALIASAQVRRENLAIANGNVVRIPVDPILDQEDMPDAGQGLQPTPLRQVDQGVGSSEHREGGESPSRAADIHSASEGERPAAENAA